MSIVLSFRLIPIVILLFGSCIGPQDSKAGPGTAPEETRKVFSIAHRGGIVPGYPENTLAAFSRAIELGCDAIEIDLRGTRDGEVVILHDPTLDRTTNGQGNVTDFTLGELRKLDAGNGQSIPTYQEVLELIAGTEVGLLLDIKVSETLDKKRVVRLTEENGAVSSVIVGVRTLEDLAEFQALNPELRTLGFVSSPEEIESFISAEADIIRIWPNWIHQTPELVDRVHALGKPVWVTAGAAPRAELELLVFNGVDGILSDFPKLLGELLPYRMK